MRLFTVLDVGKTSTAPVAAERKDPARLGQMGWAVFAS